MFYDNEQIYGEETTPSPVIDYTLEPFTIESLEDNNTITPISTYVQGNVFYYSTDKTTWTQCNMYSSSPSVSLNRGGKLYLKIDLQNSTQTYKRITNSDSQYFHINATKKYNAMGNIMSLVYGNDFNGQTTLPSWFNKDEGALGRLFMINSSHGSYNDNLISARNLVLPEDNANFPRMFWYCRALIYAPKELKYSGSIDSTNGCYWGMFCYTPSLQETPLLYFSSYTNEMIYAMFNTEGNSSLSKLKRVMLLKCTGGGSYGTNSWHWDPNGGYYYKDAGLSTSCYKPSNFTYRDFSYDPDDYCHIWAEPETPYSGYVSGCSDYFVSGDSVTLQFYPLNDCVFNGWYDGDTLLSTNNPYTFTASTTKTIKAKAREPQSYTITVSSDDITMGSASGGGTYVEQTTATVTASSNSGYKFVGWYENGSLVSSSISYTFTVTGNRMLVATFEVNSAGYTEVSYIKAPSATSSTTSVYFNTGINTKQSGSLKATMQFVPLVNCGDVYFGHMGNGYNSQNDSKDHRLFWYSGELYCDVGSSRSHTSVSFNNLLNYEWWINYNGGSTWIKNLDTGTYVTTYTYSGTPNIYPFYINVGPMKFKSLNIESDGVTVFDGIAVLDSNNIPCIYDKVSGEFIYNLGNGTITYEA